MRGVQNVKEVHPLIKSCHSDPRCSQRRSRSTEYHQEIEVAVGSCDEAEAWMEAIVVCCRYEKTRSISIEGREGAP